jgi:hypothetical protein
LAFPHSLGLVKPVAPLPAFSPDGGQPIPFNRRVGQISPDSVQYPLEGYKDVDFRYTAAAFTLSSEPGVSSCGADLPGDWALYAVSVRRLIASESRCSRLPALRLPSDGPSQFRPCLRLMFVSMSHDIDRVHT